MKYCFVKCNESFFQLMLTLTLKLLWFFFFFHLEKMFDINPTAIWTSESELVKNLFFHHEVFTEAAYCDARAWPKMYELRCSLKRLHEALGCSKTMGIVLHIFLSDMMP